MRKIAALFLGLLLLCGAALADDLELKKRRARILVQMHLDDQRKKQAEQSDHSPSRYLDPQTKGKTK